MAKHGPPKGSNRAAGAKGGKLALALRSGGAGADLRAALLEARASEAREAEVEALAGGKRSRRGEMVDHFAERWVRDYGASNAERTNRNNAERVKKFAHDFKGVRLDAIDRPTARTWALENPQRARYARSLYRDAMNDGLVEANPFANLRLPQSKGRRDEVIPTEVQLVELAEAALGVHGPIYGPEVRALVLFTGYMGLRKGEVVGLRWSDIDFAEGMLTVERQVTPDGLTCLPKTGKVRRVVLTPQAREALGSFEPVAGREEVFGGPRGNSFTHPTHQRAWELVRAASGLHHIDFHSLRHVAGSLMAAKGVSTQNIAWQLGNTAAICERLYVHTYDEIAEREVKAALGSAPQLRVVRDTNGTQPVAEPA